MSKTSARRPGIRLRGVRHNNLKNFDVDLPLNRLIVVTGPSGSGKSSFAFDTLFAEGQRRYIETFSPYARQFLDRMDKPQVDSIEGIPPAIAIEQRNAVKTTRSTVGTMTEICDYMKSLWPTVARLYCRGCGRAVRKDAPQEVWREVMSGTAPLAGNRRSGLEAGEVVVGFSVPLSAKLSLDESLALVEKQGYRWLVFDSRLWRLDELRDGLGAREIPPSLTIAQDRIRLAGASRSRFVEACEQAYHYGKGRLYVWRTTRDGKLAGPHPYSNRHHCAACDIEYREPVPALFSFNHPLGACPACRGFGRVISIDYDLALPDRSRTLAEGVVKPWQTGLGAECQQDLMRMCRKHGIPTDVRYCDLPSRWQDFVLNGEKDYGKDEAHEWPRAWYGVKGYFRWLESKAYKMHVRVLLSRYRAYTPCPDCKGKRLQPESLLYQAPGRNVKGASPGEHPTTRGSGLIDLADFYSMPIGEALAWVEQRAGRGSRRASDPVAIALEEVRSRLRFLNEVGLGYLTLDRPTRSLSGGETERVNLTTCLGTRLVNALFVLDEPSVGLHPRDTDRLVGIVRKLRDIGNTVVVVEHDPAVMRAADRILDLGPGHGVSGGELVFQGAYDELLKAKESLTGDYLSGRKRVEVAQRRPVGSGPWLTIDRATRHNLNNLNVRLPLRRLVCLTGVSGSGKTTLAREVLVPALAAKLDQAPETPGADGEEDSGTPTGSSGCVLASGWDQVDRVVVVDQSLLARTPRSNPAVYVGAFEHMRFLFADSDLARQRGLGPGSFSFNSAQGQCERCRGAGFEKIEMQFLSDVYIRCPDCEGRRYRPHILEIKLAPPSASGGSGQPLSISDLLDSTVDEAVDFLSGFDAKAAGAARGSLELLQQVGLGYLKLGQPINTLSGGESQRLRLVRELAQADREASTGSAPGKTSLFVFDEPTTGLHFDDVRILLRVFQKLVDRGASVLVIEHNLEVIKAADWVIDLGPEAGAGGGRIVAEGTPEAIAACQASHTGEALRGVLSPARSGR